LQFSFSSRPLRKGPGHWVTQWLISAVGLALVARWVDGVGFSATGWEAVLTVLSASAVLGLLNLLLKPILLIVTLPVNIMTLGLFTLVVNELVLWAAAYFIPAFSIHGFWTAVWAALVLSLLNLLLGAFFGGASFSVRADKDGG
jgi:putative membrane protein